MIHLDTYLENFESKLEEIQNSIVYVKSYKKPKIKISRLSEERKFVPVELDIEINENLVIKDRFDWNLNDENVSVDDFVNELCDTLNLPEINRTRLKSSLIYQLIDYVERNTYNPRLKNKDQKNDDEEYELDEDIREGIANSSKINGLSESKLQNQLREQQEEDQKKTARQRKLDEMRRSSNSQIQPIGKASYIRDRRSCKNCNYVNNAPSFECKKCKIAFYILEMLDLSQWKVAQAVQYFEVCLAYFPLLGDYVKDYTNLLSVQDFSSIYSLKVAFYKIFPSMKELSEVNLKTVYERLEDLFASFLAGIVVYRQEQEALPQKKRGRKSKAWHEDQEKRKREKKERKERGEIVSSDVEDEDDSEDEEDLQAINKKIQEIEQQANNQGGQYGAQNSKEGTNQDNIDKEEESNYQGAQNEGYLESNTEGSALFRRGRGRPPKKLTYLGKKRGRKAKGFNEQLSRGSSKNIGGDQDKDRDDEDQLMQDGQEKRDNQSEGDDEDEEQDSKLKSLGLKNDEDNEKEEKIDEESFPATKNPSVDSKVVKSDLNKRKDKYLEEDDDEQFDVDDEDDEDYGSVAKKSSGKRGRPPKNKSLVVGKRGRKPLPKKDEKQQLIDEEPQQNQENPKEEEIQQNENNQNAEEMEIESQLKADDKEKQSSAQENDSKIQQQQENQSKISKKIVEDDDEASNQMAEESQDDEFQIKKQPVKTGRRGRPRKEEQQVSNKEQEKEEDEAEDQESTNFPNKKQKIIQKPLRTRFTRHLQQTTNGEDKHQGVDEEERNESSKIQTKKSINLRSKIQENNSEDEEDYDKSQLNQDEEDYEEDKKKKKKEKINQKKKDLSDDEEEFDLKKGRPGRKRVQKDKEEEEEDESEDKDASNLHKRGEESNDENEESQKEDEEKSDEGSQDEEEEDPSMQGEQASENESEEEQVSEDSPANGVRTRRSQRTHSNDSNTQKKKEIPKQKKIVKEKSSSYKQETTIDAPRKKGRPPKKIIQRGRKK